MKERGEERGNGERGKVREEGAMKREVMGRRRKVGRGES